MNDTAAPLTNRPVRSMTGGRALAEMLQKAGAGPMFGMGGFQLLPFYDAVREIGLAHSLINDERCGIFAADAWARVTGRPGLCDATLGPGATNLATGLVESLNAGVPLVSIIGDTNRDHSWKNMTQEARQTEILAPAVKAVIRVERTHRLPELVRRAYAVATSGRAGPVLLDVPEDVCHDTHSFDEDELWIDPATTAAPARRIRPDAAELERAAALLSKAERPVILAGGGVHLSGAAEALTRFAEAHGIPVAHTLSGKGAVPCNHPLCLGLFGRYSRIANDLIEAADCLLVIGCKLGEIATRRYALPPAGVPLIHIDIVAEEIGRCAHADVALWADCRAAIQDLADALGAGKGRPDHTADAAARMAKWREETESRLASDEVPVSMARVCRELTEALPEEAILVADGGFAAHWTGLLWEGKRAGRCYVANRGFASIGYGLPGAIGAQLAAPEAPVVGITGDGGFNMMLGELETAKRLGLGFTLLIVNNAASGYVKALQQALFGGRFQSSDLSELDYAAIARQFGCEGLRVERPDQLAGALAQGMASRSVPTILDVVVTRDPAKMLPGVDNRAAPARKGDRIA